MASAECRRLNLESKLPFAVGLTSEVYSLGEGRILKLLMSGVPRSSAEREFKITQVVRPTSLLVPDAIEIVEVDGRWGIIFERVEGISMAKAVETRPWTLFSTARYLAELHAQTHAIPAPPGLPSQRDQLQKWMDEATGFPAAEKEEARRRLARFPDGQALCHGDFHPANILLSSRGPVIIDWSRGTQGEPIVDVARTSVLFETASLPADTAWHIRILFFFSRNFLHQTYLNHYLNLSPGTKRSEIDYWRLPQKAAYYAWNAWREKSVTSGK